MYIYIICVSQSELSVRICIYIGICRYIYIGIICVYILFVSANQIN